MVFVFTSIFISLFVLSLFSFFYVYSLNKENENKPSAKMNKMIFGIGFLAEFFSLIVFVTLMIAVSVKGNESFRNFDNTKNYFYLPMDYFENFDSSEKTEESNLESENEESKIVSEVKKSDDEKIEVKSEKNVLDIESEENVE